MREKATSWLIKVLLGAIVVVFVFWGIGSFRAQRIGRVALVNGDQITLDEYRNAFDDLVEQMRRRFKGNLTEQMIKRLQLRQQALNQLIDNKLLVQEARRLKFRVSDEELAQAITHIGAFQNNGVFDNRLYQNVLNRLRMSPEDFEVSQRQMMLIGKLRALIYGSVKVSEQEAMAWFNWANASVSIDFALIEPDKYKDIDPSEEELKAFFEDNKESYKTQEQLKVRYVRFTSKTYRPDVVITEEEIRSYYNDNLEEFKKPKTVEARHILIKVDMNADADTVEKTKERALNVMKMAREGKDFSELAKQYSEGPSGPNGGYLGTFKKEDMVRPFAAKAFSMKAGEISDPVRTQFGWHIIKVEKVNEATTLSYEDVKKEIETKLADDKAKILAYDEAEAVSDISFEGDDLMRAAKEQNLQVITTDFFTREGPEKGIPDRKRFAAEAFELAPMEVSDILELSDGYYILQVIEKKPETIPAFEAVEGDVRADLIEKKQDEKASEDANALLSAVKDGQPLSTASQKYDVQPVTTEFFKRNASIPEIGYEQEISAAAFELSKKNRLLEKVIKGRKGYYVVQLNERKMPEGDDFVQEKDEIMQRLMSQKQTKAFTALVAQLRDKGDISIKEGFLE
jgi:peptidyl-prolyl cis-trans isomerase D